jgi:hypothetical protein
MDQKLWRWKAARAAMVLACGGVLAACGGGDGGGAESPATAEGPEARIQAVAAEAAPAVHAERYVLAGAASGQCVEASPDAVNGARLRWAACGTGALQSFDVVSDGAGRYKLLASTGRALDVAGASGADGALVQLWEDNGTQAQRFRLERRSGNRFALVNAGSGKCVAPSASAGLQQLTCNGTDDQSFLLHPSAAGGRAAPAIGRYAVRSLHSQLCLAIASGSTADGAGVVQQACSAGDPARFDVVAAGGGTYQFVNVSSGKSLEVSGASTNNGVVLDQRSDTGGAHQHFAATAIADAFLLQPKHSGKCVDVAGFSTSAGGVIHQWDCTRNTNQQWRLEPDAATSNPNPSGRSAKRGIAYDVASAADMAALSPGVSWWYNWSPRPNTAAPAGTDFVPMLWNFNFDDAATEALLKANPQYKFLLVLNEPNLTDQANLSPAQAAAAWPRYEALAARTGVKIVGPAITWGTYRGYEDPVVWLDAFHAAYRAANNQRDPRIDYLAFHWYDYGLGGQLDRLAKYGKPFWVTEFANWHGGNDGAQIDTLEKQKAQMTEMVTLLEGRADVARYAWFTGRWPNDTHHASLLGADGQLTELGRHYLSLPAGTR